MATCPGPCRLVVTVELELNENSEKAWLVLERRNPDWRIRRLFVPCYRRGQRS